MKRVAIASIVIFLILMSSTYASLDTQCSVETLGIKNIASDTTTSTELTYYFKCEPVSYDGQVTKMVVTVPYSDISNVEASDGLGDMKVFEGPEYTGVTYSDTDSTIGSFFRKSIVLENYTTYYMLTLSFQSNEIVSLNEEVYTLRPEKLGSNPKITIVTGGVTETVIPVMNIDYKLELPTGSAVVSSSGGCSLSEGIVECNGLTAMELDELEIKWSGSGPDLWGLKIKDVLTKHLPSAFTNLLSGLKSMFNK